MTRITHPNLFRFAVLLTMTGLGVEAASLHQTSPLGLATGLALILLGLVLYTAAAFGLRAERS